MLYFKSIVVAISPIVILTFLSLVIYLKNRIQENSTGALARELITTICVILFILHPAIARYCFSLFYCVELDPGEHWLFRDLSVRCWSGSHLKWSTAIGIPMFLAWVVGAPLLCFIILCRNRRHLLKQAFFEKFRMVY